jgi:uncharacterized integral membrane protein
MRTVRRLLAAVLFVAALVGGWRFAHQNQAPVTLDYFFGVAEAIPLWTALAAAFGLGVALAAAFGLYQAARLSLTARRWRKTAGGLESELHQLRNLPLASQSDASLRGSAGGRPPEPRGGPPGAGTAAAAGALEPTARGR